MDLINQFVMTLLERGYNDVAEEYINKAMKIAKTSDDRNLEAKVCETQGILYFYKNNYDKCIQSFFKAISICEEINNEDGMASGYNNVANVYFTLKNRTSGEKYLKKAYQLYRKIGSIKGMVTSCNNLGVLYQDDNINLSISYAKKALDLFQDDRTSLYYCIAVSNLEVYYYKANRIKEATKLFNEVVKLGNEQKYYDVVGEFYQHHAVQCIEKKEFDLALLYFKESLRYCKMTNNYFRQIEALEKIGECYTETKNVKEAEIQLIKALEIAKQIKSPVNIKTLSKKLYDIYTEKGDYKKACEYYKLYTEQNEFIQSQQITEIETLFNYSKSEKEIDLLNIQKAHKDTVIKYGILIAVILFISGIIFFINQQRRITAFKMIVKRNMEIVESEKKLSLLKEQIDENPNETLTDDLEEPIEKYVGSRLNDEKKTILLEKIMHKMEKEKLFLNPNLTIKDLADSIDTNTKYLSQVINEFCHQSFNNYINEYRVKEARAVFSDPASSNYTIEYIATQVGFNSKASFNSAFKKYIGVTPSFYLNSSKEILNAVNEPVEIENENV